MTGHDGKEIATFAGGCFWCFDALFRELRGVTDVKSGFSGGEGPIDYSSLHVNPKGYAESVQVTFDPQIITYEDLLDIFWHMHNPTTLNRQGVDVGQEYRSAVFYHSEEQKKAAEASKKAMDESHYYDDPIVTAIEPYKSFTEADEEHQNFYNKNKGGQYCLVMIDPKLSKLRETFRDKVKK